jgi:hypothetical protein
LDIAAPRRTAITVTATNAGHRPMLVALRPRMLAFQIEGPGGSSRCEPAAGSQSIPRDLFTSIKPSGSVSMTVILAEACPRGVFDRPGLYRLTPTLHATASGAELGLNAYTAVVTAKKPTYVRLLSGPEPFYTTPPRAVPIPKPRPPSEDDPDSTADRAE